MKRYFKITNRIKEVIILLCTLIGQPLLSYADTLSANVELRDNSELFIKGILSVEGGRLYILHDEAKSHLPDSLLISEIVLKYEGHRKEKLIIKSEKDTLFSGEVDNDLVQQEIKTANGGKDLFLSLGNLYTFTHGDKEWKLNLEKGFASESENNTSDGKNSQEKDFLFIIVLVEACVIFVLLIFLFIRRIVRVCKKLLGGKRQNEPKGGCEHKGKDILSTQRGEDKPQNGLEQKTSQTNVEQKVVNIYSKLCSNGTEQTIYEQLDRICVEVGLLKDDKNTLNLILEKLTTTKGEVIKKIEQLQEVKVDSSQQSENEIKEKFAKSLLDTIKSTSDKELKQMIEKAEKGCSKKVDIISKLLQDLRGKKITSGHTQMQITEEQLNDSINGSILANWIFDQMGGNIDGDYSTPSAIFSAIAKKLNAAGQEVEEELSKRLGKEFPALTEKTTDETIKKIKNKVDEANKLVQEKKDNEETIARLKREKEELLSTTKTMLDKLHSCTEALSNLHPAILSPCSDEDTQKCESMEDRLREGLSQIVADLNTLNIPLDTPPATAKKTIQDKLIEIMSVQGNTINTICCYYAYSRLPFMTDTSRQSGIIFNRQNMNKLYDDINNLFVSFGISFDIPALFVMGLSEGDYDDLTGTRHSELEILCSNSWTHIEKIDSESVPRPIIVDIANVGYSVDGERKMKTSVLTHFYI